MPRYLLCMTGASGAAYGLGLMAALAARPDCELHLVATDWARRVILAESGASLERHIEELGPEAGGRLTLHAADDLAAPPSSGSFRLDGALVAPCSMGTAGAIAAGLSTNLVQRAGAVALKEGWPLVLVPRESPLSLIALRNLLALREAGAVIMPACPGFYSRPTGIAELVDQIVCRALDALGSPSPGAFRWAGEEEE